VLAQGLPLRKVLLEGFRALVDAAPLVFLRRCAAVSRSGRAALEPRQRAARRDKPLRVPLAQLLAVLAAAGFANLVFEAVEPLADAARLIQLAGQGLRVTPPHAIQHLVEGACQLLLGLRRALLRRRFRAASAGGRRRHVTHLFGRVAHPLRDLALRELLSEIPSLPRLSARLLTRGHLLGAALQRVD